MEPVRPLLGVLAEAGRWEGSLSTSSLTILLRASASNEDAAAKMRNIFGGQIVQMLAKVTPPAELAVRAGLVSSQLLGLALCRYVLKVPPVVVVERERFGR